MSNKNKSKKGTSKVQPEKREGKENEVVDAGPSKVKEITDEATKSMPAPAPAPEPSQTPAQPQKAQSGPWSEWTWHSGLLMYYRGRKGTNGNHHPLKLRHNVVTS